MPRVVLTFSVANVPAWRAQAAQRAASLAPFASGVCDFLPIDGGNVVAVIANVNDMLAFNAALLSPAAGGSSEPHPLGRPLAVWVDDDEAD